MVGGAGERPVKAISPALGLFVPVVPRCGEPSRLAYKCSIHKKAHADLSAVPEIARVRGQGRRLQCGLVRIVARACVPCADRTIVCILYP